MRISMVPDQLREEKIQERVPGLVFNQDLEMHDYLESR
jgi:hypothetical protein